MIIPNWREFKPKHLFKMIRDLIDDGKAKRKVFVLDTLKKFGVDLMDKKSSSEYGNLAREFTAAGGTLIALAHTNKKPDKEGNNISGGTSDLKDDCDTSFIFNKICDDSDQVHVIEAKLAKARGDFPQKFTFQFTREKGQSYWELLNTVKRLNQDETEIATANAEVEARLVQDADLIKVIQKQITENNKFSVPRTKLDLIKHIAKEVNIGERKVRRAMNFYEGHRWTCRKVGNERPVYELLHHP
jgi:hypothetical protein